jgi:hypothetical protein
MKQANNKVPNGGPVTNHTPAQQSDKHNDTNSLTNSQMYVFVSSSACVIGIEGAYVVGS